VKVTVIFPGAIGTNIAANSGAMSTLQVDQRKGESSFKMLAPAKAAEIIVDGIEQNKYRVLVGQDASFMDFLYRFNPQYAAEFIFKQMKALLAE
jgi:short-subunit dehydrogenase